MYVSSEARRLLSLPPTFLAGFFIVAVTVVQIFAMPSQRLLLFFRRNFLKSEVGALMDIA